MATYAIFNDEDLMFQCVCTDCECESTPLICESTPLISTTKARQDLLNGCKCGGRVTEIAPPSVSVPISFDLPEQVILPKSKRRNSSDHANKKSTILEVEIVENPKEDPLKIGTSTTEVLAPVPPSAAANKTVELIISGMTCSSCVSSIEHYLTGAVDGVQTASVNLLSKRAVVTFDSTKVDAEKITKEVTELGYPSKLSRRKQEGEVVLLVKGLSRLDSTIQQEILDMMNDHPSIDSASVNQNEELLFISYKAFQVKVRELVDFVDAKLASYPSSSALHSKLFNPEQLAEDLAREKEIKAYRSLFLWCLLFSIPAVFFGMVVMVVPKLKMALHKEVWRGMSINNLILLLVTIPVQFWFGRSFYQHSWHALRRWTANMDVLIMLGTNASFIYSVISIVVGMSKKGFEVETFFEVSVLLITFVFLGRWLENMAKGKTSDAIRKLLNLRAPVAVLLVHDKDGAFIGERSIESDLLEVGDVVKVSPGAILPADGIVVLGQSLINQSMITGESMPVHKEVGDDVVSGAVNTVGLLHVRVTKTGSDTMLAKMAQLVGDAQTSKAKIQKFADKLSSYFVPIIIIIALFTLSIWLIVVYVGAVPEKWLPKNTDKSVFCVQLAISVLVIACPCALGLATPTAVMVGTGLAAKHHILIKGAAILESGHHTSAILFDKTGTLTQGEPTVTDHVIFHHTTHLTDSQFWTLLVSVESPSEHPLAKAIVAWAKSQLPPGDPISSPSEFTAIPGRGIVCNLGGETVLVGNRQLMVDNKIDIGRKVHKQLVTWEKQGKTAMLIAKGDELLGALAVSDPARPEAKATVTNLKRAGLMVGVVSGDNKRAVSYIAHQLGIDRVFAEVLPKHKRKIVKKLQKEGHVVAFVGDGINDSPALAQSDVGIAIGTGTDIAIESADMVLTRSDLRDIAVAFDIARKTYNRIRINFGWAFGYNMIAIPIAAGVFFPWIHKTLPPWIAGLAMALSSVSVVLSSLHLKLYKPGNSIKT